MAAAIAERNLLFGLLALQVGLIDQSKLVAAFQAWTLDKARSLANHFIARGDLEMPSAIIKRVAEGEGSRLLARPEQAEGPWLKAALANLGIMYEAIQAVSHILDVNQLLEKIMDLIVRSIEADRGCIMLYTPDVDDFEPKAGRWRDPGDGTPTMAVSRTIVEHVLKERVGVLCSDAARDERFNTGQSIIRYGIREVICVPMRGRHETLGVLYLDTQVSHPAAAHRDTTSHAQSAAPPAHPPREISDRATQTGPGK